MTATLLTAETLSWVGRALPTYVHEVGRSDIAKFARSIGARATVHYDPDAARAAGYRDCVAPLGYYVAIRLSAPNLIDLGDLGTDGVATTGIPPSDATKVMAGTTRARFGRRIVAGDVITLDATITDITEKSGRSGPLILVDYRYRYRDSDGEIAVEEDYSRVLR
ncbi:FAS1-like dehydratase domain-containing protein [Nocardia carnea]|uniref:FAS1-like dehydratase domain-containing protein n=1 Tax=Nocardia carnea TaxID=37328 RepID=UPI002454F445|nr:MaoC family dehydratase N-terminal domain-containing protein [Nocardia carnea]